MTNASPHRPPLFVAPSPLAATGRPVIQKVLIANRGEIACRIAQTCAKLNITSVAIYVDEDSSSRHIKDADEAVCIGSVETSTTNPFLDIDLLVQTALSVQAQAIHPGYGYLSENADFANKVRAAGLIFIGPSARAMSTLGDKRSSKDYLRQYAADVPLVPGFTGSSQDPDSLGTAAAEIGFPVMLKASAGGGGKGMRIVREPGQLKDELERAQSEARRSFGSDDLILEKYIESSKHVEIQIVGDSHGEVLSFGDRDCSVQRRHQKVIEETPCTFLSEETRQRMASTAIRIAQLIGYENAGTVEFIVDATTGHFYFLEVNARLQVEHPITEEVTGVDLVSLQLFVAAGGRLLDLPVAQGMKPSGHAIECRLCAEDPARNFFPEHGKVQLWRPHGAHRDVRFETAIQTGSTVSIYFDSMIAKVVVWAPTRALAIEKMANVLANTACMGITTNQLFLQRCLTNPAFADPGYTTDFIPGHLEELLQGPSRQCTSQEMEDAIHIIPALVLRRLADYQGPRNPQHRRPFQNVRKQFRNQRHDRVNIHCDVVVQGQEVDAADSSPRMCVWTPQAADGVQKGDEVHICTVPRSNAPADDTQSAAAKVTARYNAISQALRQGQVLSSPAYQVAILSWTPVAEESATGRGVGFTVEVTLNGTKVVAHIALPAHGSRTVFCHFPLLGTYVQFQCHTLLAYVESLRSVENAANGPEQKAVAAPMPCRVLSVLKQVGEEVKAGESVMVVESMKMELSITASASGKFQSSWKQGDAVEEGKILCTIE
ncbi:hypothetical protein FE257_007121 [Aspergillus nanangensis]|uniref:Uncharacterized protein n=1 Tax=Aspergillus nanangensis TaxID=2582783 RepID=A0AAD4CNR4_ASPNN|nr:hypothetical protein FE257_007121 [Aspergillus nanangensis]